MVDGFPLNTAAPDHAIQLQIERDLHHAQRMNSAFEAAFPEDPAANVRTLVGRSLRRPDAGLLYPALAASPEPGLWLMPLLRRLIWSHARREAAAEPAGMLADMVQLTLSRVRSVSEEEFVALAEASEALLARRRYGYLGILAAFAGSFEKSGPLRPPVVDALRHLLRLCEDPRTNPEDRDRLLWPFFRSETAWAPGDPCWSARVRRDLAAMPPKLRSNWLAAFHPGARTCQAAVKRLGAAELEATLPRWIAMLREESGPVLSPLDTIVFRHLLTLCEMLGGTPCDELLYLIACSPWPDKPERRWFHPFLQLLRTRPQNRAFACLEALMMNPITATPDVRSQYDALLAVFGAETIADSPVGVDGFPLDSDPLLAAPQRRIDRWLHMAAAAAARGRYVDPAVAARQAAFRSLKVQDLSPAQRASLHAWEGQMTMPVPWFPVAPEVTEARNAMEAALLEEFSADPAGLNRALTARAAWVRAHQHEYSRDALQLWNEWLHGLQGRTLAQVDELTLESLLAAIEAGRNSTKVFELCRKYVAKHGWHADLIAPFRQFISRLGVPCNHTECSRAEWFLWFETVAPIEPDACWSHRVKADLRAMPPEEAAAWRALLENTTFAITGAPPARWTRAAETLFQKVGAAAFRRRFVAWFEPFANGEPQRITIAGRHILRVLMWYALIAKDPAVDHALLGFAHARWKTKQYARRVAQAEMAFSHVLAQRQPEAALPVLESLVASGQAWEGSTTCRVYQELCARQNHPPLQPIAQETSPPKAPAPNPILDNLTVGEYRNGLT